MRLSTCLAFPLDQIHCSAFLHFAIHCLRPAVHSLTQMRTFWTKSMVLFGTLLCALSVWDLRSSDHSGVSTSNNVDCPLNFAFGCTCSVDVVQPVQTPKRLDQDINFACMLPRDLPRLQSLLALNNYFTFNERFYV